VCRAVDQTSFSEGMRKGRNHVEGREKSEEGTSPVRERKTAFAPPMKKENLCTYCRSEGYSATKDRRKRDGFLLRSGKSTEAGRKPESMRS